MWILTTAITGAKKQRGLVKIEPYLWQLALLGFGNSLIHFVVCEYQYDAKIPYMKFKLTTTKGIRLPKPSPNIPLPIEGRTINSIIAEGRMLIVIPLKIIRLFITGRSRRSIHIPPQIMRLYTQGAVKSGFMVMPMMSDIPNLPIAHMLKLSRRAPKAPPVKAPLILQIISLNTPRLFMPKMPVSGFLISTSARHT